MAIIAAGPAREHFAGHAFDFPHSARDSRLQATRSTRSAYDRTVVQDAVSLAPAAVVLWRCQLPKPRRS
jgi:hypothetical protein